MAYITTEEINTFLGTSWEDTLIDALILDATDLIDSLFHVDSFEEWTRTDEVKYNYKDQEYCLKNYPVSEVLQVNDINYTWTINDDYKIVRDRQVIFRTNLSTYIVPLKFEFFNIQYTAWYATIPQWIKTMMKYIVWWMYNDRKTIWITEYSLWDERIRFRDKREAETVKKLFNTHKKLILWF